MKRPYIGSPRFPQQSWAVKVHTGLYENVPTVKVSLWDLKNKSHVHHVLAQNSQQGPIFNYGFTPNIGPLGSSFFGSRDTEFLLPQLNSVEQDQLMEGQLVICNAILTHLNLNNALTLYEQLFRRAAYNILKHDDRPSFLNPLRGVYVTVNHSYQEKPVMLISADSAIALLHETPPITEFRYYIQVPDVGRSVQSDHRHIGPPQTDRLSLRIYPHIWDLIIGKS